MDALVSLAGLVGLGYWLYPTEKREGSRATFGVGLRRGMRR